MARRSTANTTWAPTLLAMLRQHSDSIVVAPKQCGDNCPPIAMQVELQHKILEELKAELAAHPVRRSRLADYDGLIADMREAGAPWRTIRRYLAKTGLEISAEAIRAYWHRHHKSRSRSTMASSSNPKPQTKPWTFNPPSTLE